jgi:multiple sugar transport system permease protein
MTKQSKKSVFSGNRWQLYVLLAPFLTIFSLMIVLPVLASMVLSFFNFDMVSMPTFAGLDNYIRMFLHDDIFPIVLKNTILLAILTGPAGFLLSFVLAWFINEFGRVARTIFSFMFYAPSLAGHAVYIWQILFSSDSYGYINSFLMSLGITTEPIAWLSNSSYIVPIVVAVQLWSSLGISFLSNLSGLQNINPELYEAGAIDGIRNRWQELWYITLPGMKHMLLFSAVMQIASAFSISGIITQLAGYPTVGYAADTIVSYLNDVGTVKYEMGYASALSVILFLLMVTTRWITNKLINKTGR